MVERRLTQGQRHGAVTVVEEEPVVARPAMLGDGDADRLMSRARDLEVRPVLALEADLPVVDPAGGDHRPIEREDALTGQALRLGLLVDVAFGRRHRCLGSGRLGRRSD